MSSKVESKDRNRQDDGPIASSDPNDKAEALRRALNEGKQSGAPMPFDLEAFKTRKAAQLRMYTN